MLNSAPELIDRIQRLTERLTELLSDKNQNSIADILENVDKTTKVLAERAPDLADAMAMRGSPRAGRRSPPSSRRARRHHQRLVNEQGQPAGEDLRKAIASVQKAADNLDAMVSDARPGVQNFTKSTLPEANQLVRDLRDLSQSLKGVSERVEQGGIGGALGPQNCPTTSRGRRNEIARRVLCFGRPARWRSAAAPSADCSAAAEAAGHPADADAGGRRRANLHAPRRRARR